MVETEKYRKEVLSIVEKARQLNSFIGTYQAHYLNKKAQFTVLLSNGCLDIDIEFLRDYEENASIIFPTKLRRNVEFYVCSDRHHQRAKSAYSKWNNLFGKER